MAQDTPRIVIAGAGIGGLHAALQLHAIGVPVTLCETASELRELGVGINLLPHSVKHLCGLGLQPDLDARAIRTAELSYHSRDGKLIWQEPRGLEAGYEFPQYSIHRGRLHGILAAAVQERLGAGAIRLDHHLEGFEQDASGVTARFRGRHSGETHELACDILIGADGIHSTLRRIFYPDEGEPRYSGLMHWRGITWARPYRTGASMFMAGDDELKLVAYPIARADDGSDRVLVNWIAERRMGEGLPLPPEEWNRPANPDDFIPYFADWDFGWLNVPEELLRPAEAVYEFPMCDRDPVPQWTRGRVSLLGDAAHPMRPNGSNGASQAILDGVALAAALKAGDEPEAVLRAYEDERRPPTTKLVLDNRKTGPERVMQMVADRCPGTCGETHECVPQEELAEIANAYKQLAGFAKDQVNKPAAAQ
jgi:2-polyprenyl-6-methoxyphenol hydroxylase-like FAD-dependent oxidoreductase